VTATRARFIRDNLFLVAAVSLPLVVVGFFLLASTIPRWIVPPPAHDLVLEVRGPYDEARPRVAVDFEVRNGRLEAAVRRVRRDQPAQPAALFLFDHETMTLREIPFEVPPNLSEDDAPATVVVAGLEGRTLLAGPMAPDGYELRTDRNRGPGLVGELFGMNRYDTRLSLVNRGRVIPIDLPGQNRYMPPVQAVAWLADDGPR
jgi:hypothetical protein